MDYARHGVMYVTTTYIKRPDHIYSRAILKAAHSRRKRV